MATLINSLAPDSSVGHLRPFDAHRDLRPVADLVELCFAQTLDPDGERYLQQMRSAAQNSVLMSWASAAAGWASAPLSGYVWEEDGKLVGNLSLIPFQMHNQRHFLIANVAVHPDYRRRGIARQLTIEGIEQARKKGSPDVWLHVREENDPVVTLYRSLGFIERARRTTWYSSAERPPGDLPADVAIGPRNARHWQDQFTWLKLAYPPEVTWHMPLNFKALEPGLWGEFYRFFTSAYVWQWAARKANQLIGVMTMQTTRAFADTLWLAAPPETEDTAVYALLLHARQNLSPSRKLSLDYPARRAREAIQAAGFSDHQTLIWMQIEFGH